MGKYLSRIWDAITLRALIVPDVYSGVCRCDVNTPATFSCDHPKCKRNLTQGADFVKAYRASDIPEPPPLPTPPQAVVVCECFSDKCQHRTDPNHWSNRYTELQDDLRGTSP